MISIIVCSISPARLERFRENVLATIGVPCEFVVHDNRATGYSITHVYNLCAEKARGNICVLPMRIYVSEPGIGARA